MESSFTLVLVILAVVATGSANDRAYCKISPRHTMCLYRQGLGPACGRNPRMRGLTEADKRTLVDLHNRYRSKVATGKEDKGSPGPQPPATNMRELQWDNELEAVAQRWADQCPAGHDENRNVERFAVGQNAYLAGTRDWKEVVRRWYEEVSSFNKNGVESYSFAMNTGHYSQLVWAETSRIGCGMIRPRQGNDGIVVCNYGPAGNWDKAKVYEIGRACSRCPRGTSCSRNYPGLCTERRSQSNIDDDDDTDVGFNGVDDTDDFDDMDGVDESNGRQAEHFGLFGRPFGHGRFYPFIPVPPPPPPFFVAPPIVPTFVVNPVVQTLLPAPATTTAPAITSPPVTPATPPPQTTLVPPPPPSLSSPYCSISPAHTMCQFQGVGPMCGSPSARTIDDAGKRAIINLHNQLRARVAKGLETRGKPGPQPSATNMMELQWDDELAAVAQRWADQCQFGHDSNRNVPRFQVGQNVFQSSSSVAAAPNWNQTVQAWYNEVDKVDPVIVPQFSFSMDTGHYTQLVWATTSFIGCGMVTYKSGNSFNTLIVCNYGEGGNMIGSKMYDAGTACSACPSGTSCSVRVPGLCIGQPTPTTLALMKDDAPREGNAFETFDRFSPPPQFPSAVFPFPSPPFILPSVGTGPRFGHQFAQLDEDFF